nr:hypothetical protein [Acidithiobacillus ferruginosus]
MFSPWGILISITMMVMMMAITPSLNASSRLLFIAHPSRNAKPAYGQISNCFSDGCQQELCGDAFLEYVLTMHQSPCYFLWPARLNIGAMTDGYPDGDPRSLGYSYIAKPQLY